LGGCEQLTDVGIARLGAACHGLRALNLSGCEQLTNAGITQLGAACPDLCTLTSSYTTFRTL
jgi:hypothetical protein